MKKLRIFLLTTLSILFSISCEIGLGSSVDTEAPVLEISNPPADAVIRDAFAINGTWTDDGSIASVTVEMSRLDNNQKTHFNGTFTATERNGGTWSVSINPDEAELLDGNYEALVAIKDNGGHTTTMARSITIDNTPPVLILTKPNSTYTANSTEDPVLSVYGKNLFLEGSIADTTRDTWIEMKFYSSPECSEDSYLYTIETDAIAPTNVNQNNTKFAVYEEDESGNLLQNAYSKIYHQSGKNGAVPVYAKLTIYDIAETYPIDGTGENSEENISSIKNHIKGNKTTEFYISSDLARDITKSKGNGGYGYAPIDIYNLLNGTATLRDSGRTVSADEKTAIETLLKAKAKGTSVFSINPDNNPYFTVSGLKTLSDPKTNFSSAENGYFIKNGSLTLEISVFMGSDSYELVADSENFYAYLIECDENGIPLKEDVEANRIKLYSKYKETGAGASKKLLYKIAGKEGHKTTSGAYVFSAPISKSINTNTEEGVVELPLKYGCMYLIRVSGQDTEGNAVDNDSSKYGFRFTSSGAAPVITITEPATQTARLKKGDALTLKGYIESEEAGLTLSLSKDNQFVSNIDLQDTDVSTKYSFEYTLPKTAFDQENSKEYTVLLKVIGSEAGSSATRTVSYDVEGPVINITSQEPLCTKNGEAKYINGIFNIEGIITDSFDVFESGAYEVLQNGVKVEALSGTSIPGKFTIPIDTTQLEDKKPVTINIIAKDRAGNETTETLNFVVDQSTDKPVISSNGNVQFPNAGENVENIINDLVDGSYNLFTKTSTLYLNIEDDDGLAEVIDMTLAQYDTNTNTFGSPITEYSQSFPRQTVAAFHFPDLTGIFKISVRVEDKNYISEDATPNNFTSLDFYVRLTGSGPDVTIVPDKEYISLKNGSGNLKLTFNVSDEGNGPYKFLVEGVETGTNLASGFTYEKEYTALPDADNRDLHFKIKDKTGVGTDKSYTPKFDNESPTIEFDSEGYPATPAKWGDTDNASFYFKGTVADTGTNPDSPSGVSKVQIYFRDGEVTELPAANDSGWIVTTSTPSTWNYLATWADDAIKTVFQTEGKKTVFVKASDGAGNENETVTKKTFVYDTSAPEVTEITGKEYTNADTLALEIKVKDTNPEKPVVVLYKGDVQDENKQAENLVSVGDGTGPDAKGLYTYSATITFPKNPAEGETPAYVPDGTYNITVTGKDSNGRTGNTKTFRCVHDKQKPKINNLSFVEITSKENADPITKDVYSTTKTGTKYYYTNNSVTGRTYKISGVSTDNVGLKSVDLKITNTATTNPATAIEPGLTGDTGMWEFTIPAAFSTWTTGAEATITVTDVAGNPSTETLNIVFDTIAPKGVHEIDSSNKNLYFRIGNYDNDDIISSDPIWNDEKDKGVGGKYGNDTYGNATTIQIRGKVVDDDSDVATIYYKVYPDEQTYTNDTALEVLKNDVLSEPTGQISPLSKENIQKKRVFYNVSDPTDTNQIFADSTQFTFTPNSKGYYKYYKEVESNFNESITGFSEGGNYLVLVAVDNAGNAAVDAVEVNYNGELKKFVNYSLNVDKTPPSDIKTLSTSGIIYTNGTNMPLLWGTVSDSCSTPKAAAGIKSFVLSRDGVANTVSAALREVTDSDSAELQAKANADPTLRIWEADVSSLLPQLAVNNTQTVSISVTVTDNAGTGNTTPGVAATITVDTGAPTVTIVPDSNLDADTSDEAIQVNGIISLSGTAEDDNGLNQLVGIYYKVYTGDTTPSAIPANTEISASGTDGWKAVSDTANNGKPSNWKFTGIDTTALEGTTLDGTETKVCFSVAVKDKAGNIGYSEPLPVIVNQDTDRPVITVTNPYSIEALSQGSVTWEMSEITGTVTDDDAITYFGYYIGNSISYEDSSYHSLPISNGIWKIPDLEDGTNHVFFKITAGGKDYYANTSTTYNQATVYDTENNRGTYKLTDGTNKFGYREGTAPNYTTKENILTLIIDTTAPDVETAEYSLDGGTTWQTGLGSVTLGGTLNSKLKIRQSAWDQNGVKWMNVKVIEAINGVDSETPLFNETYSILSTPAYVPEEDAKDNGRIYLVFTTTEIDLSSWLSTYKKSNSDSNTKRVEISISDGIKATVSKLELTVDNTAPVISFSGPERGSTNSGEVTVYGTTDERGTIYYTVSTDGEHAPGTPEGAVINSWTGYTVSEDGSTITPKNNGTITGENGAASVSVPEYQIIPDSNISWYVYFDDNTSDTQRAHANLLKKYAKQLGITTDLNTFTDLVNFYIWIKIEDAVGNTAEYPYLVCVDPQGDRPAVTLSNPEKAGDSLGGTVKLFGFAEDSNGTVQNVWIQLLSEKNGAGYGAVNKDSNNLITSFTPTENDILFWLDKAYSVYFIEGGENPVELKLSSNTQNTTATVFDSSIHNPAHCYIKANFSGSSWNLKINTQQEFDPAGTATKANGMAVRVCARDNDMNMSYPVTRYFIMDKDTPVISNVMLRQYADTDTAFANPLASQEVRSGMYVKGKWYLEFTAKDNSAISSVMFSDSDNNDEQIPDSKIDKTSVEEWNVRYLLNTDSPGVGSFIRTIKATDNNTPAHTGTYQIEINYDNEAPKLLKDSSSDFNISEDVKQSNGFYKLYSKVSDATTSATGTPSGIKAVGFYFMRRKSSDEGLIYDPLQKRAAPLSTNNLSYEDGLYWMEGTVSCEDSGAILLGEELLNKAAYIHTGSYIKLGGVMYKITSSNSTSVTIAESHENSYTRAKIALAQFVDNRKSEYEASSEKDSETGYYTSIKNDDSDGMVEELGGTNTVSSWQGSIVSRNIPDGPIEIHYTAYDESMNYALGIVGNKKIDTYKDYETAEAIEFKNLGSVIQDGQYASYVYTFNESSPAYISNNGPRLTAVTVAIDYSGTNDLDHAKRYTSYYQRGKVLIDGEAVDKNIAVTKDLLVANEIKAGDVVTGYKGFVTLKGTTWIIPEMVGGNGKLWYDYKIYNSNNNGMKTGTPVAASTTAAYFDNGEEDFDTYIKSAGGQTYVEAREKSPILHEESFLETLETSTIEKPTWFDYTIYDSTEGETDLKNNQKANISIALAVKVKDVTAPNVVINPFYWNDAEDNSLYGNSTANGHIELENDLSVNDGKPKVSGKIVVRGYAYDNKRLKELKVYISKSNVLANEAGTTVAVYKDNVWHDSTTTEEEAITGLTKGSMDNTGWEFKVDSAPAAGEDEDVAYSGEKGHKVKWTLAFDTSKVNGVAATDVVVKVIAVDGKDNTSEESEKRATTGTSDEINHSPTYPMDVVPYIAKVYTSLAKLKNNNWSVYNRTALGHYPVASDETIYIYGFNLGDSSTPPKYNGTSLNAPVNGGITNIGTEASPVTPAYPHGTGYESYSVVTFPVGNVATSGELNITVNDVQTLNNSNNSDAKGGYTGSTTNVTGDKSIYDNFYNRLPNGDNNNLLTDDVILDVWDIDPTAVYPMRKKGGIAQAVMKINPVTGQLGFAFANAAAYFSMPGKTVEAANDDSNNTWNDKNVIAFSKLRDYSYTYWNAELEPFTSVGFAYDKYGYSYGVASGGDINSGQKESLDFFSFMTDRWGKALGDASGNDGGYGRHNSSKHDQNAVRLETNGINENGAAVFETKRIKSPSVVVSAHGENDASADTNVYLAYYDVLTSQLRFRAGNIGDKLTGVNSNNYNTTKYYELTKLVKSDTTGLSFYFIKDKPYWNLADGNRVKLYTNDDQGKKVLVEEYKDKEYVIYNLWENDNKGDLKFALLSSDSTSTTEEFPLYDSSTTTKLKEGTYYIKAVPEKSKGFFGNFTNTYGTTTVLTNGDFSNAASSVANLGIITEGTTAGEYLSMGVIPKGSTGGQTSDDVVVIVWYGDDLTLHYAYNTTPSTIRGNGSTEGWTSSTLFSGDLAQAGEYCQLAVDAKGGIHIAVLDSSNSDLVYAYIEKYDEPNKVKTCVVDSSGILGDNLMIDVAMNGNGDDAKAIPRISYYNSSTKRPKLAYLVDTSKANPDGAEDELFTGRWECSVVPTSSKIDLSDSGNKINVGVWKDSNGVVKNSKPITKLQSIDRVKNCYSTSYGIVGGNGTANPILGYIIKKDSTTNTIETAQMK